MSFTGEWKIKLITDVHIWPYFWKREADGFVVCVCVSFLNLEKADCESFEDTPCSFFMLTQQNQLLLFWCS